MNWNNWGTYRKAIWRDYDPTTHRWHIDHIIPKSMFDIKVVGDEPFNECWVLSNLRPYSAKQNIIDNDRGARKRKGKQKQRNNKVKKKEKQFVIKLRNK